MIFYNILWCHPALGILLLSKFLFITTCTIWSYKYCTHVQLQILKGAQYVSPRLSVCKDFWDGHKTSDPPSPSDLDLSNKMSLLAKADPTNHKNVVVGLVRTVQMLDIF
jgi:hypothetical protein